MQVSVFIIYLLEKVFPHVIVSIVVKDDGLSVYVKKDSLSKILYFLKLNSLVQCKQLLDVLGVDYPSRRERFELLYNLLSLSFGTRVFVKVKVGFEEAISSVVNIFDSAGWLEREVWDMYGIFFSDHPDLRRILTDYGFEGFPLRKDFPLIGYNEVRYDDVAKRIVSESVEVTQEFRYFDFVTPWDWHGKE